jgi:hypothetical protein
MKRPGRVPLGRCGKIVGIVAEWRILRPRLDQSVSELTRLPVCHLHRTRAYLLTKLLNKGSLPLGVLIALIELIPARAEYLLDLRRSGTSNLLNLRLDLGALLGALRLIRKLCQSC